MNRPNNKAHVKVLGEAIVSIECELALELLVTAPESVVVYTIVPHGQLVSRWRLWDWRPGQSNEHTERR